ncbi:Fc.00g026670.m01.CDS01 [Cosmosporella sp. VM-42]
MSSEIKVCSAKRTELIQVHDHCPDRPYVELEIPQDAKSVVAVSFTTISRDQGWADTKEGPSFTWFDATVYRPAGRTDLRIITANGNRLANPEFFEQTQRWDLIDHGPRRRMWIEGLQAGDVIQLIPKANYMAWVNIIKECSIEIEYKPKERQTELNQLRLVSNASHYTARLNPNVQEIRLLNVEPGGFDDPIKGYFSRITLEDVAAESFEFHALSYCWGDPDDWVDIHLRATESTVGDEGVRMPFSVGRTVGQALRRLRLPEKTLKVWIDAVCINQEDFEERAQQVNLMSHIYSMAATVHIWLGQGNPGVEACLRLVRDIHNYNNRHCPGGELCSCIGTPHLLELDEVDAYIQSKKDEKQGISFRGMYEVFHLHEQTFSREVIDLAGGYSNTQLSTLMSILFENPWFARVWVMQEALFSRKAFVYSSGERIPWNELLMVNAWLENPQYTTQQQHIKSQIVMAPIWKTLRPSKRVLRSSTSAVNTEDTTESSGILDVFLAGLDLKSTDPRDKLFALLTFADETCRASELDDLILPNYDKSTERVFADFTRWWIKKHNSLDILSFIHSQPGRTWQRTLGPGQNDAKIQRPSWTVRNEGRSRWVRANLNAQFEFRATGKATPDLELLGYEVNPDSLTLQLQGHRVGTITALAYPPIEFIYPYNQEKSQRRDISAVFDRILDPCAFTGFWGVRSIRDEKENTANKAQMEYSDHVRSHWAYFPRPKLQALEPSGDSQPKFYETDKLPTCFDRCFFVTGKGRFGICPWATKEGDLIVLLDGGNVPYLLRLVGDAEESDKGQFELIGECYVDGVMYGEYLQQQETDAMTKEVFSLV